MTSDNAAQGSRQPPGTTSDNRTPRLVDRDYRFLREQTARCEQLAGTIGNDRARKILDRLAERGRGVLAPFRVEPALHEHLSHFAYGRAVALLAEMLRQAAGIAERVVAHEREGTEPRNSSRTQLWVELDALTEWADDLGALAVANAPQLHLDTQVGARALSRRLISAHQINQAADQVDAAIARARALPYPDPAVDELAATAVRLRAQAAALWADQSDTWMHDWSTRQQRAVVDKEKDTVPAIAGGSMPDPAPTSEQTPPRVLRAEPGGAPPAPLVRRPVHRRPRLALLRHRRPLGGLRHRQPGPAHHRPDPCSARRRSPAPGGLSGAGLAPRPRARHRSQPVSAADVHQVPMRDESSAGPEPVGAPTRSGAAFHYCAAAGKPPACGRVTTTMLLRHVALPAADVPADLRCWLHACREQYAALDAGGDQ
ncbi:hypothetical protein [Actinoplanes sp. NPDC020271]|uniref:hypothetical protein n=1 Tax=Actinoplanes sp. NPDC020271 TaxID=3363896 RepID=UPI00379D1348